jgi:hypothetical protein
METGYQPMTEVWAQLVLSAKDSHRIREFLMRQCGIKSHRIVESMHLTVYYARRPMPGVISIAEPAHVVVSASDTRFMVMAPGGENPRPALEPAKRKVGLRVQRQSSAMPEIMAYRQRLFSHESIAVLGRRRPSNHRRNAFGARHFQAHVSLLKPGSGIDRDLTKLGSPFRDYIGDLVFDKLIVDVVAQRKRTLG